MDVADDSGYERSFFLGHADREDGYSFCPPQDDDFLKWLGTWRAQFAENVPSVAAFNALLAEIQIQTDVWMDMDLMNEVYDGYSDQDYYAC